MGWNTLHVTTCAHLCMNVGPVVHDWSINTQL